MDLRSGHIGEFPECFRYRSLLRRRSDSSAWRAGGGRIGGDGVWRIAAFTAAVCSSASGSSLSAPQRSNLLTHLSHNPIATQDAKREAAQIKAADSLKRSREPTPAAAAQQADDTAAAAQPDTKKQRGDLPATSEEEALLRRYFELKIRAVCDAFPLPPKVQVGRVWVLGWCSLCIDSYLTFAQQRQQQHQQQQRQQQHDHQSCFAAHFFHHPSPHSPPPQTTAPKGHRHRLLQALLRAPQLPGARPLPHHAHLHLPGGQGGGGLRGRRGLLQEAGAGAAVGAADGGAAAAGAGV